MAWPLLPRSIEEASIFVPRVNRALAEKLEEQLRSVASTCAAHRTADASKEMGASKGLDAASGIEATEAAEASGIIVVTETVRVFAGEVVQAEAAPEPERSATGPFRPSDDDLSFALLLLHHASEAQARALKAARDEAEEFRQRSLAAEHRLHAITQTVMRILPPACALRPMADATA